MRYHAIDTQWLTHASFEPMAQQRRWLQWPRSGLLAFALLLIMAGAGVLADAAAARGERATLDAEVERLRTELAVERATRAELGRHAAGLNTQVAELTRQVDFLSSRSPKGARAD